MEAPLSRHSADHVWRTMQLLLKVLQGERERALQAQAAICRDQGARGMDTPKGSATNEMGSTRTSHNVQCTSLGAPRKPQPLWQGSGHTRVGGRRPAGDAEGLPNTLSRVGAAVVLVRGRVLALNGRRMLRCTVQCGVVGPALQISERCPSLLKRFPWP